MGAFCEKLGLTFNAEDLKNALSEMEADGDGNGQVDLDEFVKW